MKPLCLISGLLLVVAGGCNRGPLGIADAGPEMDLTVADLAGADLVGADLYVACPTGELAFTQADGCANDGSVEFCIPDGDAALQARIAMIAPSVTCAKGGGRAKCDSATQLLCSFPTPGPPVCTAQHGALSDEGWSAVCALAALPEVKQIVHTIFD